MTCNDIKDARAAFTTLLNALDTARDSIEDHEQASTFLDGQMAEVEKLVRAFDAFFTEDTRDDAYERAAARDRRNDFEDTNGKDWT